MLLRPYSLGHELWLIRENNSVLRGTFFGLPAAVLICCQTWTQLQKMRSDHLLALKLWIWKRRTQKLAIEIELAKFLAYRSEGILEFPISETVKPGGRTRGRLAGAPFILRLQTWLMLTYRLSEAEAWDYPVGLAKMRWESHWEQEGALEIYNAEDGEMDAYIAEREAEKAAKREARAQAQDGSPQKG
jgi:hypothetical protein